MANHFYGLRKPVYVDYVAIIRHNSGGSSVQYIRESFGSKAAYAKIAKHFESEGKIEKFAYGDLPNWAKEVVEQGNPGLVTNIWFGFQGP